MIWRVGILDVSAAILVLFVLLLPPPRADLRELYSGKRIDIGQDIAAEQSRLAQDPHNGAAAQELSKLLVEAREFGWALRVSGTVASQKEHSQSWRALLALAVVHAERLEVKPAHKWASKSLTSCESTIAACPVDQRVRLEIYSGALKAGVDSGIDPTVDPRGFKRAIERAYPMAHRPADWHDDSVEPAAKSEPRVSPRRQD